MQKWQEKEESKAKKMLKKNTEKKVCLFKKALHRVKQSGKQKHNLKNKRNTMGWSLQN